MNDYFDVVIIGGGPAGSTAGAILASSGIKTLILDKEKFPRYHIGESLLASCKTILEISGAYERVAKHGFQIKHGARMKWGDDDFNIDWVKNVNPDTWSWQVEREHYDYLLLSNARDAGATVIENGYVRDVSIAPEGGGELILQEGESSKNIEFKYVIDASGRESILSKKYGLRQSNPIFKNSAMWSYWNNVAISGDIPVGALQILSTSDGWWWVIPFSNGKCSIGFVTSKANFLLEKEKYKNLDDFYKNKVQESPELMEITRHALKLDNVMAENDYSYTSSRFCGSGYFLSGDSACFLDPLLSTGVHLAQFSALIAAATITGILHGEISEENGLSYYESIYRRAFQRLLIMVANLYNSYEGKDDFFWSSQQLTRDVINKSSIQMFSEISSGVTDLFESQKHTVRDDDVKLIKASTTLLKKSVHHGPFKRSALFSVDLTPIWEPWRNITGDCTKYNGMELILSPSPTIQYVY